VLGSLLERSAQRAALHLDVLVAVPLHPEKLTGCGFNRSIEIARWVARAVQRPGAHAWLTRARATRPQAGPPLAERHANLQGALAATVAVRNRRAAIVDDVLTMRGTGRECARALRRAGAASVQTWHGRGRRREAGTLAAGPRGRGPA